jgi:hypothetical protein
VPVTGVVNTVMNLWVSQKMAIPLQDAQGHNSEYRIINFNCYGNMRLHIVLVFV